MSYNFSNFKSRSEEVKSWLNSEYSSLRTGRATPLLLDSVMVDSYGSKVPIKHLANINIEDAKTLRLTPWDQGQIKAIETAIAASNIGVSTSPDSSSIRVIFPDLTQERRQLIVKLIKEKLEEAKVSLRKEREKVLSDINNKEKDGNISEDEKFRYRDELQKIVDDVNDQFDKIADKKMKEILEN